jgi:hypothetical protein
MDFHLAQRARISATLSTRVVSTYFIIVLAISYFYFVSWEAFFIAFAGSEGINIATTFKEEV